VQQYFAYNYDGPAFNLFGAGHLVVLALVAAISAWLIWGWRDPSQQGKDLVRRLFIGAILIVEASWHGWNLANGTWNLQEHLPLHLCSISMWSTLYLLLTRDYRVYEIIFFVGIAGATMTLLTPDAGKYGLPHFRAIQTLAAHGLIVFALIYMTRIEGYRPTWKSLWKTMAILNVYMLVVTPLNFLLGSNYMFTLAKPETASLLDMMGPWPWYLLVAEVLAIMLFSLLYLPFALQDRRAQRINL
jgi:hypothetical integral membrane protein (TIGR02206 family)